MGLDMRVIPPAPTVGSCFRRLAIASTVALSFSCDQQVTKPSQLPSPNIGIDLLSVPSHPNSSRPEYVDGRTLLLQTQKAYNELESYVGKVELQYTSSYGDSYGSFSHPSRRQVYVWYKRPDRLRLESQDSNGDQYIIVDNGRNVQYKALDNNYDDTFSSVRDALYAYSGVSLGATVILPGLLMDIKWNNESYGFPMGKTMLDAWATMAKLTGTVDVDGVPCHRIVCEREIETRTIFVDSTEPHLVRRVDYDVSPSQIRALEKHGGRYGYSGRIQSVHASQHFYTEALNTTLSNDRFTSRTE